MARGRGKRKKNRLLDLAAVGDDDTLLGGARRGAHPLHRHDDFHALDDVAENNVLAIEPRGGNSAEEELGAVGVGAGVGHGEDARAVVLNISCEEEGGVKDKEEGKGK